MLSLLYSLEKTYDFKLILNNPKLIRNRLSHFGHMLDKKIAAQNSNKEILPFL